jgi:hypothetical protein
MTVSNALSTLGKNSALDAWAAIYTFGSLHSAYPADTGANEIAGGAPAYSRETLTFAAAAAGSLALAAVLPTFDVPGGGTVVAWLGAWDAGVAGNFGGAIPISGGSPAPFTAEDSTDVITCDQHGFADTNQVFVMDTTGAVLPTGLTEGVIYFVRDATTDTFKLALTSGGAAIDITVDGAGFVQRIIPETFANQGQVAVNSGTWDLLR